MKLSAALNGLPGLSLWQRYAKFCAVGSGGTVVDMAILHLLVSPSVLGWNLSVSKIIAAEMGLLNNFIWNDLWTFSGLWAHHRDLRGRLRRFAKFNLICTAGIVWSVLLLNVQLYWLHINLYLANFISIVVVSLWNFFLNLRFDWRSGRADQTPSGPEPMRSASGNSRD